MYDQKYFLQIYKMDSLARQPLQKSVEEAFTDFNHTISTPYSLDNTSPVEYLFKLTKPVKPLKIYLKINGTDNKILAKNDTVAYYYSRLRGFALTYNQADFFDIIGRVKEGNISEHVWHELLFLRRNNGLYFLTMCPKEAKTDYIPGLLYKVIK
ncbi:MAG: hypothetical protein JST50_16770 [Bacteroidetes bacterium]|nr:hypothetical protein [Bacteroidota bacterium]